MVQRERAERQVESLQPERRDPDDHAEQCAYQRRGGQRQQGRRQVVLDQHRGREGAGRDEPRVAERDLAREAGQQIERERADGGQRGLRDEIEHEGRHEAWQYQQGEDHEGERRAAKARVDQRQIARVGGLEVAAAERHLCAGSGLTPCDATSKVNNEIAIRLRGRHVG